jgi:hypothetical protein
MTIEKEKVPIIVSFMIKTRTGYCDALENGRDNGR